MTLTNCFFHFQVVRKIEFPILILALFFFGCQPNFQENYQNWDVYKGDAGSSSYSSLDQINKENVNQLQLAWTFSPLDAPVGSRPTKYEVNPIIIDTVMYATSARHWLYAINAKTGKTIWSYDPFDEGEEGGIKRGVTWWEDGNDKRILFTAGSNLIAVDAHSGKPISTFGDNGKVDLKFEDRIGPEAWVIPTSPGIVYDDILILGSEVSELYGAAPGDIRAFNVRTGKLEWTFHTIPHPGEPGYETWPEDAWQYVGGANNWGGMSLDEQRGIVYIPLGSPSYDYYGADRIGKNLYGNSLVALEAKSGKYIWHFQAVHHDLWDYDLPAPANLVTVERNGKSIDAVALTTKIGFLFLLDRESGEPLFPVEERPVPSSTIPGEESWPTQPYPLKPEPYARQFITEDDLTDITPEARDSVLRVFRELRYEGLYTPPDLQGTLMVPGSRGGSEWGGAAHDPATGILYINANESPEIARIQKAKPKLKPEDQTVYNIGKAFYANYCANCHGTNREGLETINPSLVNLDQRMTQQEALQRIKTGGGKMPPFASIVDGYEEEIISFLFEINKEVMAQKSAEAADTATQYLNLTAYSHFRDPEGRNAIKPPWGTLNAINLNTGEYKWRIPLGNYPELQKEGAPPTGTENWGGPIVTAGGLVFIAATMDQKFRAFDKDTGEKVWETTLPGNGYATPATFMVDGKQFVAIAVMGTKEDPSGHIMAFALEEYGK